MSSISKIRLICRVAFGINPWHNGDTLKRFYSMDIKINTQLIQLNPLQEQMIQKKINPLAHLACRLEDESSEARVDLIYTKSRQPARAYRCHVTFFVPGSVLRAEA